MKVSKFFDTDEMDELPSYEPTRRDQKPVSGKHDLQRRSENGMNRFRKERANKEKNR